MNLDRPSLDAAVSRSILTAEQAERLWKFLAETGKETPSFRAAHILYYAGGLIAIGAMTLFMTLGWERFGGAGLLFIAGCYGVLAIALTEWFLRRKQLALPAGITAALAIVMVPLAVYGAQHLLGFWPMEGRSSYRAYHTQIDWRWLLMDIATLAAGVIALWRYRLPFMVMPVAVTLWYMSMDIVPFLFGGQAWSFFSPEGKVISTVFGVVMVLIGFWVDLRSSRTKDFAFWLYVFGVITFWGGLTTHELRYSEIGKLVYLLRSTW